MRFLSSTAMALVGMLAALPGAHAQPGSGVLWEITMQMEGMNMGLPAQTECMSANVDEAPPQQDECEILEQRSSGNHHFIKAKCKEGLVEIDHTRTASTMTQRMKMTDNGGETTEMTMVGRNKGACDYTATHKAREQQVAAFQKQADDATRKSKAEMAKMCDGALESMEGYTLTMKDMCPGQQKEFCRRLNALDGYAKAATRTPHVPGADPAQGLPAYARSCGLNDATLLPRFCREAAVGTQYLGFISGNCPAESAAISARECAGRSYSNQAAPAYRDFCAGSMSGSDETPAADGDAVSAPDAEEPQQSPEEKATEKVKKGVKSLKHVFGI